MIDAATLLLIGALSFMAIHSRLLLKAVIYLAAGSVLAALLYLRNGAPELAIAEAAIGSGLVTLLYLAALKRNRTYTIAIAGHGQADRLDDAYMLHVEHSRAIRAIRNFFVVREFEVQIVFVPDSLEEALESKSYDLVLFEDDNGMTAYTDDDSYIMMEFEMMLQMRGAQSALRFQRYERTPTS
ncbi:MAG: Na(+)/H(+) antiporter subunit B [Kiritimatiellia bacterium]